MTVKILIVDDEPEMAILIRQKFRKRCSAGDLEFVSAADGIEALECLEAQPDIAVTLCDINMPRMDGLELLERMKNLHPLVKSVVISAYGDLDNIRAAMQRGAFDFLFKPIVLADLELTLGRALEQAQQLREMIHSLRHNSILRMYVNAAVFRFLSGEAAVAELQRPETIEASVVFFDVCGFTNISERLPANQVAELLNTIFDPIVTAVVEHDGQIDKFIGDAVMAIFRGREHERRAVHAARAARAALVGIEDACMAKFGVAPIVSTGINAGTMVACSVGARSLSRFDFTVIGDTVNIAARIQDAAGQREILVSEAIIRVLDAAQFMERGSVLVKGRDTPVRIWAVLGS